MKEDTVEKALLFGLRPSHGTYPTRQLLAWIMREDRQD